MCRHGRGLAALLLLAATLAVAADSPPTTIPEKTAVRGRVPLGLAGRWLAVHDAKLPNGKQRSFARVFEVRREAERLEVHLPQVEVPEAQKQQINQAGKSGKSWAPTLEDVALFREGWNELPAIAGSDIARIEVDLVGNEAFDDDLKQDAESKGSDFAIVTKEFFSGAQPVQSTIAVYGVREMGPMQIAGTFVSTSIAVALIPVPITLRGTFRAYRLDDPPPQSLLGRLLDVFRGCGRR